MRRWRAFVRVYRGAHRGRAVGFRRARLVGAQERATCGGSGEGAGGEGGAGGDTPPSFDDFLKTGGNQAEFDRRVQKAVNTAVTKAQEKWQALADDKLSEAEKLAKMTKEEKAQYMQQKREKELTDREAAITRKELMAEAKNTLASDGLPQELAEVLDYSDADTCKKSMEKVKEVFQRAVETAVEEKLKGGKPPKKAPGGDAQKALEEQVYNIMMGNN